MVTEMNVRYQQAAEFDDLLTLTTAVTAVKKVAYQPPLHRPTRR